jgi:hypothetical protein
VFGNVEILDVNLRKGFQKGFVGEDICAYYERGWKQKGKDLL